MHFPQVLLASAKSVVYNHLEDDCNAHDSQLKPLTLAWCLEVRFCCSLCSGFSDGCMIGLYIHCMSTLFSFTVILSVNFLHFRCFTCPSMFYKFVPWYVCCSRQKRAQTNENQLQNINNIFKPGRIKKWALWAPQKGASTYFMKKNYGNFCRLNS